MKDTDFCFIENIDINKIITLGNQEKYLVISHVTHNDEEYYYIAELDENGKFNGKFKAEEPSEEEKKDSYWGDSEKTSYNALGLDFIGYLPDTFGHSQNVLDILRASSSVNPKLLDIAPIVPMYLL